MGIINTNGHTRWKVVFVITLLSTATGYAALFSNDTGMDNTASGGRALYGNTTGEHNIGLGSDAGGVNSAGSDNIWIGHYGYNESNTLRIGQGTGTGNFRQNRAFISGIRGITTGESDAIAVLIDSNGQLGTASSSRRVKEAIADIGSASERTLSHGS